jgi:N-acetylmuramoyl-L-alanine amidase
VPSRAILGLMKKIPGKPTGAVRTGLCFAALAGIFALCMTWGQASSGSAGPEARVGGARIKGPDVVRRLIPFGPRRRREMAAYSERHYGERTWRLVRPRVIVEHWAEADSATAVYNTFAPDHPDSELGELPNTCAHFVISGSGRIFQLVSLRIRCRHTVGLNWTAIGIEHTGFSDGQVLDNPRQMRASLRLTRYLRCRFQIKLRNVIGHAESLSSPYHRERVASLRRQTHGDWRHASMRIYRHRLRERGDCPVASS